MWVRRQFLWKRQTAGKGLPALLWVLSSERGALVHNCFWVRGDGFFLGRFLFKAGAELPLADLLSAHVGTVPDDLFESEEERAHPIYQAGSDQLTQGRAGRAPFQKLLSCKGFFY
jgi:hypothetical protein